MTPRLRIIVAAWLILASVAFFGMIYSFPAIVILLVAWTGGVISLALVQEAFPEFTGKLHL